MAHTEAEIKPVSEKQLTEWCSTLLDSSKKLVDRARALWGLRHAREQLAVDLIGKFLIGVHDQTDPSSNALLQHEAAYCLGQRGDPLAIPILENVIRDEKHCMIVRHEAGEALAALVGRETVDSLHIKCILEDYAKSDIVELAETCQIGLARIEWLTKNKETLSKNPFPAVIDPAPAFASTESNHTPQELSDMIMNDSLSLFDRYRSLFTLRNHLVETAKSINNQDELLSRCLVAPGSALLRHEVAFVLGEIASTRTCKHLCQCISNINEQPMVRHEAAEALGAVLGNAKEANVQSCVTEAEKCLTLYLEDEEVIVKESCVLALDVADYISSNQFQYAAIP